MLRTVPLFLSLTCLMIYLPIWCGAQSKQRSKCPRRCKCFSTKDSNSVDVDCSKKKLTDVPIIPKNAVTLVISDNQLLQILPRTFNRNKKLENLYLYRNKIKRVHWNAFQDLTNLQTLSLFDNRITEINNGTFRDLSSLKQLYLYQNRIRKLNKDSFVGLSSLETLSLRDNNLNRIKGGTFLPLGQLESLFLFRNNLTKLTYGMFEGLRALKTMIIGMNRISEIENGAFRGLSSLTELYIDNNKLDKVTSRMFADLTSLKRLHIYNNAIKRIDPGSFYRLRELTFIAAHHNKISHVTPGMFAGLVSLKVLHLQANRINQIHPKSFVDLRSLQTLYLYQNKLRVILDNAFVGLKDLKELHLGFNQISEIQDGAFAELKQVTTFYVDSNKLSRISKKTFAGLYSLLDLYVYLNRISYVANGAFSDNKVLRYIAWDVPRDIRDRPRFADIAGNLLFCDCHAKYFKRWLAKHPAVEVTCFAPQKVKGASIRKLMKLDFEKCHSPRVQTEPESAILPAGGNVDLHCTGAPVVEYAWYRNGSKITSNDYPLSSFGTLSLTNIKESDAGTYTCAAKNKKTFSLSTVSLIVGYKPYFASGPESKEVSVGSKLILPCLVEAVPAAKISWKKYDDVVDSDEERVFQTNRGSLVIIDIMTSDEGTYVCHAWNTLGRISMNFDVTVKKAPAASKTSKSVDCSQVNNQGQDLDVSGSGSDKDNDDEDGDDDDSSSGSRADDKYGAQPNTTSSPIPSPASTENS